MTGFNTIILAAALASMSCVLHGCGGDSTTTTPAPAVTTPAPGSQTIPEIAATVKELSTLVAALKAGDLVDTLGGKGPFTVFAPNDHAFTALPQGLLDALLLPANKAKLVQILEYHVVSGKVLSKELKDGQEITTLEKQNVTVAISNGTVSIVGGTPADSAEVIQADVEASNGVVHIINKVLIPKGFVPPVYQTIPELATATKDLSTLVAALDAAGLVGTLGGDGPFTVFAPNNAAFAELNKTGVLSKLLLPGNKDLLVKVLEYHVVKGKVLSSALKDGENVTTLEGQNVTVSIKDKVVKIDGAKVVTADVLATNGVVHIIDAVMTYPGFVPPSFEDEKMMVI